jgi:hypothetical protein
LDDLFQELQLTLDQDGGRLARITRWAFIQAYRAHKAAMLLVLGWKWRSAQQPYPPIGHEPFDVEPQEIAREWSRR